MEREFNRNNLREIRRMIIEVAKGNFAYKIPRTNYDDTIEALSVQLNMMAEELRENLNHLSYVNPHVTYQHILHTSFIIDSSYLVTGCTKNALDLLEKDKEEIIGKSFSSLLSQDAMETWKIIKEANICSNLKDSTYPLEFLTGSDLLVPAKCFVSQLMDTHGPTGNCIVTFFTTVLQKNGNHKALKNGNKKTHKLSKWDIKAIQNIHDYISQNLLNPPLPNIELAHLFGINEHKLKYGFKVLFGTTPFKYYNELRMQEAKTLIKNTNNSLEAIAFNLGYKSYPHFSNFFKAKFGYSPSQFKKNLEANGEDK